MNESGDQDFAALYARLDVAEAALRGDALPEARRNALLDARAERLAKVRDAGRVETTPILAFKVGGGRYGLSPTEVDEVLPIAGLSPLPGVPRTVLGMIQARAQVLVVLDPRQLLGLKSGGMADLTQVLAVRTPQGLLGLAVENVDGQTELPSASLKPSPRGPFLFVAEDRTALFDVSWFQTEAAPG